MTESQQKITNMKMTIVEYFRMNSLENESLELRVSPFWLLSPFIPDFEWVVVGEELVGVRSVPFQMLAGHITSGIHRIQSKIKILKIK